MSLPGYAATRALQSLPPGFPARPTLAPDTPCLGLAFVLRRDADVPALAPVREQVMEIRTGSIGTGARQRKLVVVLFAGEPAPHGLRFPGALPLVPVGAGVLASHLDQDMQVAHPGGKCRAVRIWWAGAAQRVALDMLERISLGTLWTMPRATIHPGLPPPARQDDGALQSGPAGQRVPSRTMPQVEERPFSDIRDTLARRPAFRLPALSMPNMAGGIALACFVIAVVAILAASATAPSAGSILVVLAVLAALWVLRARLGGGIASPGNAPAAPARPAAEHAHLPGLFGSMVGWLRWNNPLGSSLHRKLQERVRQVDALVARGLIDDALRLALRVGSGESGKRLPRRYPNQLPQARARLDFEVVASTFETPVLSEASDWNLRQSYLNLAARLEAEGDHRRAAFIVSQLLGDHAKAVRLLEDAGLIEEAAQLALAGHVDPVVTIRLVYASGRQDESLALARRAGCFDELARDSKGRDGDYHAHVMKAWTDLLVDTGQSLRAVQVTDDLASGRDADRELLALRRGWLARAVNASEAAGFQPEPVARALLCGEAIDPDGLAAFPHAVPGQHASSFGRALARVQEQALRPDGAESLLALLDAFVRLASPRSPEQEPFWTGAGPALIEALARAMLQGASTTLSPSDISAIQRLLYMADLKVLALDIGKLGKLHRADDPPPRAWQVPPALAMQPRALVGCLLDDGTVLAWRETDTLDVFDRHGTPIWRGHVPGVTALVPVGSGTGVLVLQANRPDGVRISRFDVSSRALHPVGVLDLVAWHDITSQGSWLVQVGGEFGALDLAALCAGQPRFEFLWSCALTGNVRALAFLHGEHGPSWLTVDTTPERGGVIEIWCLEGGGKLTTWLCLPPSYPDADVAHDWAWSGTARHRPLHTIDPPVRAVHAALWSENAEADARKAARRPDAAQGGPDRYVPCDFARSLVRLPDAQDLADTVVETAIRGFHADAPMVVLRYDASLDIACLARSPASFAPPAKSKTRAAQRAGSVLLADRCGRLFVVDPNLPRITVL